MQQPLISIRLTLFAAGLLLLGGCYTHIGPPIGTAADSGDYAIETVVENIEYTVPDWPQALHADLYLPQKAGPHPVVLMIHGGGWANRSRDDMRGISRRLARSGYAVFNINYRFAPYFTYPAQLHDMYQALAWIDANAATYDLDRGRINAWGYSSGAHLAALIASFNRASMTYASLANLPPIRSVVEWSFGPPVMAISPP